MTKTTLVLFDIDGTLIRSSGGIHALRAALQEAFAVQDDLRGVELAGRTDAGIVRQIFARHDLVPSLENIRRFCDAYLYRLEQELPRSGGHLLPGILPLLEALKQHPQIAVGLLTGNLRRGAELKLTHFGVWHFFEFGAYADDDADRNRLGHFARRRATEKHGVDFASHRIFVLGDTPHDIACARAIGARAVAVATGEHTSAELARCQPDFLFEDLSDLPAVLRIFNT